MPFSANDPVQDFDIVLVLNAQTFAIAKLSQEGNAVKFARL